jgi:hypothetical protein
MRSMREILADQKLSQWVLASAMASLEGGGVVISEAKGVLGLGSPKSAKIFLCPILSMTWRMKGSWALH